MTSVVEAKRAYFKQATGSDATAVADLETSYYEMAAAGTAVVIPEATTTVEGTVKQAANVPAAAVPFADLTAAANAYNALRTALINAGQMAAS